MIGGMLGMATRAVVMTIKRLNIYLCLFSSHFSLLRPDLQGQVRDFQTWWELEIG